MAGGNVRKTSWTFSFAALAVIAIIIMMIAVKIYRRKQRLKRSFTSNINWRIEANESMITIPSNRKTSLKSKHYSCSDGKYLCQNGTCAQVQSNNYIESNLLDKWEFPRSGLILGDELGHGSYGLVVKAKATGISSKTDTTVVAVKMLMQNALEIQKKSLISELEMLKSLEKHCNIISLLGCCTIEGNVCCVKSDKG